MKARIIPAFGRPFARVTAANKLFHRKLFSTFRTSHGSSSNGEVKWSAEEDHALQVAVQKYGPNWAKVVTVLPEKTPLEVKTRWKSMMTTWRKDTTTDKERRLLGSKRLVALAMASNFTICLGKFGASIYTGSSSLLSESVHSFMDMVNQGLLLVGIHRSLKQPNIEHPYGFHKEQYAWAIISASGILFVGGGIPIVGGITSFLSPPAAFDFEHLKVAYAVLGTALCFEAFTASKAFLQVKHNALKAGISFREYLSSGADPSSVQVLLEDSSSVVGTLVAGSCLSLSYYFENPAIDALGSVIIGGVLSSVALFLIRRNLKMVIEKSMPSHRLALISRVISSDPVVETIQDVKTSSLGPEHARFKAEIAVNSTELVNRYILLKEINMRTELSKVQQLKKPRELHEYLSSFSGGVVEQLGDEIDRIEENVKDIAPEVKYVDLEIL